MNRLASHLKAKGLILASSNAGKIREIKRILEPFSINVVCPADFGRDLEVVEDQDSFEGNAALKAAAYATHFNLPALADDSGLVIDALGGEPGVYSARYGGELLDDAGRRRLVLEKMKSFHDQDRTARFVCVLALSLKGHEDCEYYFRGVAEGLITRDERGSNGFGYDPIFLDPASGKTFAELGAAEKDALSHRGMALRAFLAALKKPDPARMEKNLS